MNKFKRIINLIRGWNKDSNGYWRKKNGKLVHREVAYKKIYLKKPEKYAYTFHRYIVHHIDGDKENNSKNNLAIWNSKEHNDYHGFSKEPIMFEVYPLENK